MSATDGGDTRKTTKTSLAVVEAINELDGATLSELADHTGLATSTLHTHLRTLEETEYVTRIDNTYQLGLKLFYLGENARRRDSRYTLAKEKAFRLANQVSEEVNFAVEEYGRSIMLFDETPSPSDTGFQVGRYFHMHSSASGKAMLAEYSEQRVDEIIDKWGLPKYTENTITDIDELRGELETIREQGYAVNQQEELEGLHSVAMVINNPDGSVFGSLDVSGPPYRLPEDHEIAAQLQPVVEELESELEDAG
ncbi:IclR family transcriptional regulator [Natrarchaeobius halalkaliphilus]|uniref:IclR family transcriptional regulator n=1 Tax=Natrarchaeobius halalkaliphilus TaxID=1679091 RepID=A0A3N6M992_9EURY|nr:IclR family transcriptional regulator [Natrarchaeobius halalkaliphilus]RQG90076.1 IclR family transcriptional regulator [Natrarchaeobius halalkaliphilus]